MYLTGGGSRLLSDLLTLPGASATVLEARVPYSAVALADLIGHIESSTQPEVAGALGMLAHARSRQLAPCSDADKRCLFGFGLTAALETNRVRRGVNRAHICVQTHTETRRLNLVPNPHRDRQAEEALLARVAIEFLSECLLGTGDWRSLLSPEDEVTLESQAGDRELAQLAWAERTCLPVSGVVSGVDEPPGALLSGAFNPLHAGHEAMIAHAEQYLGCQVALELCIANADKPPLDYVEINRRAAALADRYPLWLTRLPMFVEKAKAFRGTTFLVGVDTLARIADRHYYRDAADFSNSMREFERCTTRFLVFPRLVDGRFQSLENLDVPAALLARCEGISGDAFRFDISSSQIRESL